VIGVAKAKGSVFGQSQDAFVDIPIGAYFQIYGSRTGIRYAARAADQKVLEQAKDEMRMLIRARRHEQPGQDDTFSILSSDALVSAFDQLTNAIAATAVAIVSIFMVVGGVVIMNIMLAVVSERTHEIGIRKSVGARRQDILNQFLVESSMLAGMGGLIGVVLAWMVSTAGAKLHGGSHVRSRFSGADRRGSFHRRRPVLRDLSGAARLQAGSDRSPEGGEAGCRTERTVA
jgi:putative ABC transport system permease protein